MTEAVTKLSFTEIQMIKSRGVMVYKFEGSLETADDALKVLGGVPQPGTERWFAIARLVANAEPSSSDEPKNEGEKARVRAVMLAKDPKFWEWLSIDHMANVRNEDDAANYIRDWCNINSRSELATNPDAIGKYLTLETTFRVWRDYVSQYKTSAHPPVPERPPT